MLRLGDDERPALNEEAPQRHLFNERQPARARREDTHLEVQDRAQLNEYLSQTLIGTYREQSARGRISQKSTFLKSYLVEGHSERELPTVYQWRQVFERVLELRDESLLLLIDRTDVPYCADLADPRFI